MGRFWPKFKKKLGHPGTKTPKRNNATIGGNYIPNMGVVGTIVFKLCSENEAKSQFWAVLGQNFKNMGHPRIETPKRHNGTT